ncbi:MAG: phosphoenolpyruvate carboxylase [Ferruginibacter sp.]
MEIYANSRLQHFRNYVGLRFQVYNSLFTSLPFHRMEKTGVLLTMFLLHCEEGYNHKLSPVQIIESFVKQYSQYTSEKDIADLLFRFIQYTERQVVLFDALEDAAFARVNDMQGPGTLKQLQSALTSKEKQEALGAKIKDFAVRIVLTAHPTQFYTGEVLGIINDLSKALHKDDAANINLYLQQLGKTPFFKREKPTPYDEAVSLIWFLEHVFYKAAGDIVLQMQQLAGSDLRITHPVIHMGFWPGGDRDGNPFVSADTTLEVAASLRKAILRSYYVSVKNLKRRLTFKSVALIIAALEEKIYNALYQTDTEKDLKAIEILDDLIKARDLLIKHHNGLFLQMLDNSIGRVQLFGMFFASLDLRQDSDIHGELLEALSIQGKGLPRNYSSLTEGGKIDVLMNIKKPVKAPLLSQKVWTDTLDSMRAAAKIQLLNGENGCNRYIISHCGSALNVIEIYGLFRLAGWQKDNITVDIIPLFETIDDLTNAAGIMEKLYQVKPYRQHIHQRKNIQTIMLGFSDGTKDGGYLMANWAILKAKQELTAMARKYDLAVIFFDGRGGPPARGGGKTHRFYASMGEDVSDKEIQLTIQGQTVSAGFGTVEAARYNIEQLLHAGLSNALFSRDKETLDKNDSVVFSKLAEVSYLKYKSLKNHPRFTQYLSEVSPLRFYAETNIGSRPAKRGNAGKLTLKDLRAIPYVGAWSQMKQNVTGFYGVGTALQDFEASGKWKEVKLLYKDSLFFKALLDNCEMSLKKSFLPLTEYLSGDPAFGELWLNIRDEYNLSVKYLLKLSGNIELMDNYPVDKLSISMRERIVLPLLTIQQYGLQKLRTESPIANTKKTILEKLIIRCSFGIINAGRNSA